MTKFHDDTSHISIAITLGNNLELGITEEDTIVIQDRAGKQRLNLGRATEQRFKDLQEFLGRLAIHSVDP